MDSYFRTISRIDLNTPPVNWELMCKNCYTVYKGYKAINLNFQTSFSHGALVEHSVYCKECIPKILPLIQQGDKLGEEIPNAQKVHICSYCWLVSVGIEEINENVYLLRSSKRSYQSKCKTCGKGDMKSIMQSYK